MVVVVMVASSVTTFKTLSVVSVVVVLVLMSICLSSGQRNMQTYLMSVAEVRAVSYTKAIWVTSGVTVAV